jgi:hypothetical protein
MYAAKDMKDVMRDYAEMIASKDPFIMEQYEYMHQSLSLIYSEMSVMIKQGNHSPDTTQRIASLIHSLECRHYDLRDLLGDASQIDDGIISSQMNLLHHITTAATSLLQAWKERG